MLGRAALRIWPRADRLIWESGRRAQDGPLIMHGVVALPGQPLLNRSMPTQRREQRLVGADAEEARRPEIGAVVPQALAAGLITPQPDRERRFRAKNPHDLRQRRVEVFVSNVQQGAH